MASGCHLSHALTNVDAIQPVKVVSSMGQQSVGKRFSLNHIVDTSFAGNDVQTTGMAAQNITCKLLNLVYRGCMDVSDTH